MFCWFRVIVIWLLTMTDRDKTVRGRFTRVWRLACAAVEWSSRTATINVRWHAMEAELSFIVGGSCDTDYKCLTSKSLVKHVLLFKQQGASVRGGGHAVLNLPRAWKNMKHERWCFSPMKRCELWSVYISLWRQKDVEYPALEDKS